MSARGDDVPPGLSAVAAVGQLRALGAALAEARRRVAEGAEVDFASLHRALMETLGRSPVGSVRSEFDADLLVLLDEAAALVTRLSLERDSLRERVQAWTRHRRADVSYVAPGRGR